MVGFVGISPVHLENLWSLGGLRLRQLLPEIIGSLARDGKRYRNRPPIDPRLLLAQNAMRHSISLPSQDRTRVLGGFRWQVSVYPTLFASHRSAVRSYICWPQWAWRA